MINGLLKWWLLLRWNQPTEPHSAQCEDRKWVYCSEGCLLPHCFSGPGLCGTVCTPAHTAAIMPPAAPFTQLWASVPEPAEFTQKGATPSQGPPRLWERPGLSHVPPPTWPKTGSRLKPAWMYTLLGSSEVGLLGSNFQPPCGISIHNLPTQGRDNDTQWLEVPFPQAEGLITAKLWVSSGGASSLVIRTMMAVSLAWRVARQNSVVLSGSLGPTYQRTPCGSSEQDIPAPRLNMGSQEDWGSELPDRHPGSAAAATPSVCVDVTACWPSHWAWGQQGQPWRLDHSVLVTTPALLVDKHWCLKTCLYNMNQPSGLFLGLQCWSSEHLAQGAKR